jgi:hypothetical protein
MTDRRQRLAISRTGVGSNGSSSLFTGPPLRAYAP